MNTKDEQSPNELKAIFFYVAVNLVQLERLAPGLKETLAADHAGMQTAGSLALWCAMSGGELEPLIQRLEPLASDDTLFALGVEDGMDFALPDCVDVPDEHKHLAPWLIAHRRDRELWLSFDDNESPSSSPHP